MQQRNPRRYVSIVESGSLRTLGGRLRSTCCHRQRASGRQRYDINNTVNSDVHEKVRMHAGHSELQILGEVRLLSIQQAPPRVFVRLRRSGNERHEL